MTATVQAGPGTAMNLLFGPGADAAEALARQIKSAETDLDRTLRQLRPATRQAAVRETAAAAAGLLDVRLDGLLLAGLAHPARPDRRRSAHPGLSRQHGAGGPGPAPGQRRSGAVRRRHGRRAPGSHDPVRPDRRVRHQRAGRRDQGRAAGRRARRELRRHRHAGHPGDAGADREHAPRPACHLAVSPGIRLLPAADYPAAGRPARPPRRATPAGCRSRLPRRRAWPLPPRSRRRRLSRRRARPGSSSSSGWAPSSSATSRPRPGSGPSSRSRPSTSSSPASSSPARSSRSSSSSS